MFIAFLTSHFLSIWFQSSRLRFWFAAFHQSFHTHPLERALILQSCFQVRAGINFQFKTNLVL